MHIPDAVTNKGANPLTYKGEKEGILYMKDDRNLKPVILLLVIGVILLCIISFILGIYFKNSRDDKKDLNNNINTPSTMTSDKENSTENLVTTAPTVTVKPTEVMEPTVTATPTVPIEPTATPSDTSNVVYQNTQFGFDFTLPDSWKGYSVLSEVWQGNALAGEHQGEIIETGIKIIIRHPEWTKENPRQDIPIMVFTLDQWSQVEKETISVSAAPVGPSKLGSNSKYVFALPARYNFAYETGYEEVDKILNNNSLVPNEKIQ